MDTAALQAFVQVVQHGSFTRAADALQTHKAHLSRVVSALERDLGARLLERTTRSLSLTELGREFHARAQAILAAMDDARQAVQQAQGEPRGTLRLTCGVEFGMLAVSDWIHRYLSLHPQMQVDAEITGRLVDLVHEGFDLAIRVGPLPDSTLAARRLGHLRYALYAAPDYLQRRGTPRDPAALAAHDLLVFSSGGSRHGWTLTRDGVSQRVAASARFRASNSFAVCDAAVHGLGIAALPGLIGAPHEARGALQRVLTDWALPEVPVHAVFASARYLAPKVRAFVDLASQAAAQSPGLSVVGPPLR